MLAALPALIGAGASLLGGFMQSKATEKANAQAAAIAAAANKAQMRTARMNIGLEKLFAKRGIQWKVADARRAGIHPLYALGASTASYSPVSVGSSTYSPIPETGMAQGLANAGQDISRAVTAVMTPSEQSYQDMVRALDLQRMQLSNELIKSQIARERQVSMPGVPETMGLFAPDIPWGKNSGTQPLQFMGMRWETSPATSNAQDVENRYGDEGPIAWASGVPALLDDLWRNSLLGRYVYRKYPFN